MTYTARDADRIRGHEETNRYLLLLTLVATVASAQGAYDEAALNAFHAEREKALLADNGWFTVAGLHFLNPGDNKFGSDPLNDIVLEFGDVPKQAGVITMNGNHRHDQGRRRPDADLQRQAREGRHAASGGERPARRSDHLQGHDLLPALQRPAPRDSRPRQNAPLRKNFSGLKWYPANPGGEGDWAVHAAGRAESGAGAERSSAISSRSRWRAMSPSRSTARPPTWKRGSPATGCGSCSAT